MYFWYIAEISVSFEVQSESVFFLMGEFSPFVFLNMIDMFSVSSVIIVSYAPCFLCVCVVCVLIYFIIQLGFLLFFMYV